MLARVYIIHISKHVSHTYPLLAGHLGWFCLDCRVSAPTNISTLVQ